MFRRGTFQEQRYHPNFSWLETWYYVNNLLIKVEHFRCFIIYQSLGWWQDSRTREDLFQKCSCQPDRVTYDGARASGNPPVAGCNLRTKINDGFPNALAPSYVKRCDWQAHFWNRREPGPRILIWIINWLTTLATNLIYIEYWFSFRNWFDKVESLFLWRKNVFYSLKRIFNQFVYDYVAYNKSLGIDYLHLIICF